MEDVSSIEAYKKMADPIKAALYGRLQDTSGCAITRLVDTSHFPKNMIAETDAAAYKQAAEDFMHLDREKFIALYPELEKSADRYREMESKIHVGEHTKFVLNAVKEKFYNEIADAKYPIVDHEKSLLLARAFAEAETTEQRAEAVQAYPQLADAFKVSVALQAISNVSPDAIKEQIAQGVIPQYTPDLDRALAAKAELEHEQLQDNAPGR